MGCSIDHDGDAPDLYEVTTPKARIEHKCCQCGEVIQPGQRYSRFRGLYEWGFSTFKSCLPCEEIRQHLCGTMEDLWREVNDLVIENRIPSLDGLSKEAISKFCSIVQPTIDELNDNDEELAA